MEFYTRYWRNDTDKLLSPDRVHWRGHQTPTVVSLKGRLPEIMQSKSTLSCDIIQIHSLFRHGFIKKPKSKFNRNRKWTYFVLMDRISKTVTDLGIDLIANALRGSIQNTKLFSIFFSLFSVPSFIFSINGRGLILVYPQRIV